VEAALRDLGVELLDQPTGEVPMVARAVLPEEVNARDVVDQLRAVDGVGRVDVDELRETM
jgi:hypothetical protein